MAIRLRNSEKTFLVANQKSDAYLHRSDVQRASPYLLAAAHIRESERRHRSSATQPQGALVLDAASMRTVGRPEDGAATVRFLVPQHEQRRRAVFWPLR